MGAGSPGLLLHLSLICINPSLELLFLFLRLRIPVCRNLSPLLTETGNVLTLTPSSEVLLLLLLLLGYNCFTILYSFLLYSGVNQLYYTHATPPAWTCLLPSPPSHSSRSLQSTELSSVLCSMFPLVIYFTHGVYMSILISQFILPSPCPTVSTYPFSTYASLFLPCK